MKDALIDVVDELPKQLVDNIIDAFPKRLQRCVELNGENAEGRYALEESGLPDEQGPESDEEADAAVEAGVA